MSDIPFKEAVAIAESLAEELPKLVQVTDDSGRQFYVPTFEDGNVKMMNITGGDKVFYLNEEKHGEYVQIDDEHVIEDIEEYK